MGEPRWAILSLWDKSGAEDFARGLVDLGFGILASGGTAARLVRAGIPVTGIEEVTGFGTLLDGRVKTLHPLVHAGILAHRDNATHMAQLRDLGGRPIDLVAVNLYPFRDTVARGATLEAALGMIDIGGPTLLRAAAKNFPQVLVLCRPDQYGAALEVLRRKAAGLLPPDEEECFRRNLAADAFRHTMAYDYLVSQYLGVAPASGGLAQEFYAGWEMVRPLRYGENPHQRAALYRPVGAPAAGLSAARQLQGKELSYNNLADASAAWELAREFEGVRPAVVVVKHAVPCACATGDDAASAFRRAREGDPVSIFGGIVAFNVAVDEAAAASMADIFLEVVIAPGFADEALWHLGHRQNTRLLEVPSPPGLGPEVPSPAAVPALATGRNEMVPGSPTRGGETLCHPRPGGAGLAGWHLRQIHGGLLVQDADRSVEGDHPTNWQCVTVRRPTALELADLAFAWKVVRHVRSNAIVLARDGATVGIGQGQPNRVDAARLALTRAGLRGRGAVMASDGFFPFADVVEEAVHAGVTAIVQPGGSVRDAESIAACDRAGLAMLFTGVRHFLH